MGWLHFQRLVQKGLLAASRGAPLDGSSSTRTADGNQLLLRLHHQARMQVQLQPPPAANRRRQHGVRRDAHGPRERRGAPPPADQVCTCPTPPASPPPPARATPRAQGKVCDTYMDQDTYFDDLTYKQLNEEPGTATATSPSTDGGLVEAGDYGARVRAQTRPSAPRRATRGSTRSRSTSPIDTDDADYGGHVLTDAATGKLYTTIKMPELGWHCAFHAPLGGGTCRRQRRAADSRSRLSRGPTLRANGSSSIRTT